MLPENTISAENSEALHNNFHPEQARVVPKEESGSSQLRWGRYLPYDKRTF